MLADEPKDGEVPPEPKVDDATRDLPDEPSGVFQTLFGPGFAYLDENGPEWERELIDAILSNTSRFSGDRGRVARTLIQVLYNRHLEGLPALKQRELAKILYPKTYRPAEGDPIVRKAVARAREAIEDYFKKEGRERFLRVEIPKNDYRLVFTLSYENPSILKWFWRPYVDSKREIVFTAFDDGRGCIYFDWQTDQSFASYCETTALQDFTKLLSVQHVEPGQLQALLKRGLYAIIASPPELDSALLDIMKASTFNVPIVDIPLRPGTVLATVERLRRSGVKEKLFEDCDSHVYSLITRFVVARPNRKKQVVTLITARDPHAIDFAAIFLTKESVLRQLRAYPGFRKDKLPDVFQIVLKCLKEGPDGAIGPFIDTTPETIRIEKVWSLKEDGGTRS